MVVSIDTPPQDDWIKSWPYADRELSEWEIVPIEVLMDLVRMPVWAQAPDEVREIIARRLESEIV